MSESVKWQELSAHERDVIVGERLMGWQFVENNDWSWWSRSITESRQLLPSYTISITAAWEVVEKMRERGFTVCVDNSADWGVTFDNTGADTLDAVLGEADTAPEAICIAALRACGVEVMT